MSGRKRRWRDMEQRNRPSRNTLWGAVHWVQAGHTAAQKGGVHDMYSTAPWLPHVTGQTGRGASLGGQARRTGPLLSDTAAPSFLYYSQQQTLQQPTQQPHQQSAQQSHQYSPQQPHQYSPQQPHQYSPQQPHQYSPHQREADQHLVHQDHACPSRVCDPQQYCPPPSAAAPPLVSPRCQVTPSLPYCPPYSYQGHAHQGQGHGSQGYGEQSQHSLRSGHSVGQENIQQQTGTARDLGGQSHGCHQSQHHVSFHPYVEVGQTYLPGRVDSPGQLSAFPVPVSPGQTASGFMQQYCHDLCTSSPINQQHHTLPPNFPLGHGYTASPQWNTRPGYYAGELDSNPFRPEKQTSHQQQPEEQRDVICDYLQSDQWQDVFCDYRQSDQQQGVPCHYRQSDQQQGMPCHYLQSDQQQGVPCHYLQSDQQQGVPCHYLQSDQQQGVLSQTDRLSSLAINNSALHVEHQTSEWGERPQPGKHPDRRERVDDGDRPAQEAHAEESGGAGEGREEWRDSKWPEPGRRRHRSRRKAARAQTKSADGGCPPDEKEKLTREMVQSVRARFENLHSDVIFVPPVRFFKTRYSPVKRYSTCGHQVTAQGLTDPSALIGDLTEQVVSRCVAHVLAHSQEPAFVLVNYQYDSYLAELDRRPARKERQTAAKQTSGQTAAKQTWGQTQPVLQTHSPPPANQHTQSSQSTQPSERHEHVGKEGVAMTAVALVPDSQVGQVGGDETPQLFPLPRDLGTKFKRGDFDILILTRTLGFIVLEAKTMRGSLPSGGQGQTMKGSLGTVGGFTDHDVMKTPAEGFTDHNVETTAEGLIDSNTTESRTQGVTDDDVTESRSEGLTDDDVTESRSEGLTGDDVTETRVKGLTDDDVTESRSEGLTDDDVTKSRAEGLSGDDVTESRAEGPTDDDVSKGRAKDLTDDDVTESRAEGLTDEDVVKTLEKGLKQLEKARCVVQHLVSDLPHRPPVTAVLALPNVSRARLRRLIDHPLLKQGLADCLQAEDGQEALVQCLCAEEASPFSPFQSLSPAADGSSLPGSSGPRPAGGAGSEENEGQALSEWWARLTWTIRARARHDSQHDPVHLSPDVYEQILGRFCGRYSRVSGVTTSDCVHLTGVLFGKSILREEQLSLLQDDQPLVFIVGPPGSGKTMLLGLKASDWALEGYDVIILCAEGVNWGSLVAWTLHGRVRERVRVCGRKHSSARKDGHSRADPGPQGNSGEGATQDDGHTARTDGETDKERERETDVETDRELGDGQSQTVPPGRGTDDSSCAGGQTDGKTEQAELVHLEFIPSLGKTEASQGPQIPLDVPAFVGSLLHKYGAGKGAKLILDEFPRQSTCEEQRERLAQCETALLEIKSLLQQLTRRHGPQHQPSACHSGRTEPQDSQHVPQACDRSLQPGATGSKRRARKAGQGRRESQQPADRARDSQQPASRTRDLLSSLAKRLQFLSKRLALMKTSCGQRYLGATDFWADGLSRLQGLYEDISRLAHTAHTMLFQCPQHHHFGPQQQHCGPQQDHWSAAPAQEVLEQVEVLERVEVLMVTALGALFNAYNALNFFALHELLAEVRRARGTHPGLNVSLWSASTCPHYIPEGYELRRVSEILRCPPTVQEVMQLTEKDLQKPPGYSYTTRASDTNPPLPSDGPDVKWIDHAPHMTSSLCEVIDCRACAAELADYLLIGLKVGQGQNRKQAASKVGLRVDDVMLSGAPIHKPDCQFVEELRRRGIPLVFESHDLTSPPPYPGKACVIGGSMAQGLEAKVVVYVPEIRRISNDLLTEANPADGPDDGMAPQELTSSARSPCTEPTRPADAAHRERAHTAHIDNGHRESAHTYSAHRESVDGGRMQQLRRLVAGLGWWNRQYLHQMAARSLSHLIVFHVSHPPPSSTDLHSP